MDNHKTFHDSSLVTG